MGFWNALSVLAPVAPAMSDARDLRADRAKQAQELELQKAQTVTQQLAAEGARQRQQHPGTEAGGVHEQGRWSLTAEIVHGHADAVGGRRSN